MSEWTGWTSVNVTTELERVECLVWPPSPPTRSNSVYKNKPKDERSEYGIAEGGYVIYVSTT